MPRFLADFVGESEGGAELDTNVLNRRTGWDNQDFTEEIELKVARSIVQFEISFRQAEIPC